MIPPMLLKLSKPLCPACTADSVQAGAHVQRFQVGRRVMNLTESNTVVWILLEQLQDKVPELNTTALRNPENERLEYLGPPDHPS